MNHQTDLLVIGSGGGGMTAALRASMLGLDALVVESSDRYGGSTAMSGGAIWVPCNPHMEAAGVADSPEEARAYMEATVGDRVPAERIAAYLDGAPRMVRDLEAHTCVRFEPCARYPDYYPERRGGKPGARTLEAAPFDGRRLGLDALRALRLPHPQELIFGRVSATAAEAHQILLGGWSGKLLVTRLLLAWLLDPRAWFTIGRSPRLTLGNALVGRLRAALLERNVPLWRSAPAQRLLVEEGRVVGAEVARGGEVVQVRARRGVVVAAGGFALDGERRRSVQPAGTGAAWTAAHRGNTGGGLALGEELGAATDLLDDAWWVPTALVPGRELPWVLVVEKGLPHSIIVDSAGNRFGNEAAPYIDVVQAIHRAHERTGGAIPAWLVFDRRFRWRYPCGPVLPGFFQPDLLVPRALWGAFLHRAPTLAALAADIGVDAAGLEATVARHNGASAAGVDTEFGRGASLYDRYYADPRSTPNPSLGSIERGPFYAVAVWPGDLGTKGGLVTDARARVLRPDGSVIEGLYATGNSSASVMGHTYPGAGSTIGPAMTFGWIAAGDAASFRPPSR